MSSVARRAVVYLWVLPNTLLGLLLFAVGWLGGARMAVRDGILEAHGPGIRALLRLLPTGFRIQAITFGHVVLGRDAHCLECTRTHERIHVGQYQRWGPAFIPAYLLSSLMARLRGGDAYRDNAFEVQAYAGEGTRPAGHALAVGSDPGPLTRAKRGLDLHSDESPPF